MACHWLLHGCTPLETFSFSQSLIWIFISLRKQWNSITKAFFRLNIQLSLKNAFTTLLSKWCLSNKCIKKHGVWKAGAHKPNAFEAIILHAFTAHRTESSLYCHGMSCCQLEFRLTGIFHQMSIVAIVSKLLSLKKKESLFHEYKTAKKNVYWLTFLY